MKSRKSSRGAHKIFISHTHADKALADAIKELLGQVFEGKWAVAYSSDQSPDGGILPGKRWLEWIFKQVVSADYTLVLLTPQSQSKPWVLWESGAVTGAALAQSKTKTERLIPVLFRLGVADIPAPLHGLQITFGEDLISVRRLIDFLNQKVHYSTRQLELFWKEYSPGYAAAVDAALIARPLLPTEDVIQEWLRRLYLLRKKEHPSEISSLHHALRFAFSTEGQTAHPLLDVRIHRELGELYLEAGEAAKAVEQFELAIKRMPRDLVLIHKLGLAHLNNHDPEKAHQAILAAEKLDPKVTQTSMDLAGLKGRYHRELWKRDGKAEHLRSARDVYRAGNLANPDSFYLAENAAMLSFLLDEKDEARRMSEVLEDILSRTRERSIWALASHVTARAIRGNMQGATEVVKEIASARKTTMEQESIMAGWARLESARIIDQVTHQAWCAIMLAIT